MSAAMTYRIRKGGKEGESGKVREGSGRVKKVFFHPLFLLSSAFRSSSDDGEKARWKEKHAKLG